MEERETVVDATIVQSKVGDISFFFFLVLSEENFVVHIFSLEGRLVSTAFICSAYHDRQLCFVICAKATEMDAN